MKTISFFWIMIIFFGSANADLELGREAHPLVPPKILLYGGEIETEPFHAGWSCGPRSSTALTTGVSVMTLAMSGVALYFALQLDPKPNTRGTTPIYGAGGSVVWSAAVLLCTATYLRTIPEPCLHKLVIQGCMKMLLALVWLSFVWEADSDNYTNPATLRIVQALVTGAELEAFCVPPIALGWLLFKRNNYQNIS